MNALHYSNNALLRHCGGIIFMTLIVAMDLSSNRHHALDLITLSPVVTASIAAVALYLVVATIAMTLALARHGATAVAWDADGVTYHTAWTRRRFAWADLANVAIDVRTTRMSHYFVVALRRPHHLQNCFTIDVRLLAETIDQAGDWTDAAERQRIAQGGAAYVAPGGLAGWVRGQNTQEVTAARLAGRA